MVYFSIAAIRSYVLLCGRIGEPCLSRTNNYCVFLWIKVSRRSKRMHANHSNTLNPSHLFCRYSRRFHPSFSEWAGWLVHEICFCFSSSINSLVSGYFSSNFLKLHSIHILMYCVFLRFIYVFVCMFVSLYGYGT